MLLIKLFFIVISLICSGADTTVKVSVYYETLCPFSIAFIKNQLYPNYEAFGEGLIQLELIPYGFVEDTIENGNKSFTCQHGPKECFGNLIHGIVINTQPIAISAKFVYCSESSSSPTSEETLKKCSEDCGISWSNIKDIEASGQGADIMSKNGEKTKEFNPALVPTIAFNDKFNKEDHRQAKRDFKAVVCKYLDYKPVQCDVKQ